MVRKNEPNCGSAGKGFPTAQIQNGRMRRRILPYKSYKNQKTTKRTQIGVKVIGGMKIRGSPKNKEQITCVTCSSIDQTNNILLRFLFLIGTGFGGFIR